MRARCDWCGMEVEVLANGKCLLGHPIDTKRVTIEDDSVVEQPGPGDIAPAARSVRKAATPKPPRKRVQATSKPAAQARVAPKGAPAAAAAPEAHAAPDEEPWVAKISRPWAPVEPDGPSGPVASSYAPSDEQVTDRSADAFVPPSPSTQSPSPHSPPPSGRKAGLARKRETDPLDEFAPPQRQRSKAAPKEPVVDPVVDAEPQPEKEPEAQEPVAEQAKPRERAIEPEATKQLVAREPRKLEGPQRKLPRLSAPAPDKPKPAPLGRTERPRAKTVLARSATERRTRSLEARNLEPSKIEPSRIEPSRIEAAASEVPPIPAPKAAPRRLPTKPRQRPAPKTLTKAQRARTLEGLAQPAGTTLETANPETVYIPRASRPRAERPSLFSPRHAVGWGLAIAATLVAGVISLKLAPSSAQEHPVVLPRLADIALTTVPGNFVVSEDTQTKSQTLSELARNRSRPDQVYAATIKNSDGDIVALYEAIVFPADITQSKRDIEDFISLYAQGAGVSSQAFTQRPLGHRNVWSAVLPQGQAVLVFRGPEVVVVLTNTGGAGGDALADTILSARQL